MQDDKQESRFELVDTDDLDPMDELMALGIWIADHAVAVIEAGRGGQMHPAAAYRQQTSSIMTADGRPATQRADVAALLLPWPMVSRVLQLMAGFEERGELEEVRRKLELARKQAKH